MFLKQIMSYYGCEISKNCLQELQAIFEFATENNSLDYKTNNGLSGISLYSEDGPSGECNINRLYQTFETRSNLITSQIRRDYFETGQEVINAKIYNKSNETIACKVCFTEGQIYFHQSIINGNGKTLYETKTNDNHCYLYCNGSFVKELDNNESIFSSVLNYDLNKSNKTLTK